MGRGWTGPPWPSDSRQQVPVEHPTWPACVLQESQMRPVGFRLRLPPTGHQGPVLSCMPVLVTVLCGYRFAPVAAAGGTEAPAATSPPGSCCGKEGAAASSGRRVSCSSASAAARCAAWAAASASARRRSRSSASMSLLAVDSAPLPLRPRGGAGGKSARRSPLSTRGRRSLLPTREGGRACMGSSRHAHRWSGRFGCRGAEKN